ncbi:MAG: hypothetical protein WCB04_10680 [Mycobacteriales bacterium]
MTEMPALIEEATKKSDLVWIATSGTVPVTAAWHVWHEGAAYVVTGPGEQPLPPDLGVYPTCEVIVRSASNWGRVITWEASVWRVTPGLEEWDEVVPVLLAKRLNPPDGAAAAERWAQRCTVFRLLPTGGVFESGASLPTTSGAEPPRPSVATTEVRVPYTVGRRGRRRR